MKRNSKKNLTAFAAATMFAATSVSMTMGVFGDGTVYSTTKGQGSVNTTTLDKYLVMKKTTDLPSATFDFAISSENVTAVAADKTAGTLAVLPGVGSPALYVGTAPATPSASVSVEFATSDTATDEENAKTAGDTPVFVTADADNTDADENKDEKYVKKTVTIDFTNVKFTEPGVYRYLITETGGKEGATNGYLGTQTVGGKTVLVTETVRTLDVYVADANANVDDTGSEDNGKPMLIIEGYTMYDGTVTTAPYALKVENDPATDEDESRDSKVEGKTKDSSITNIFEAHDLTFAKAVTGNQGSKDKYFEFTVTVSGLKTEGSTFTVDVSGADATLPGTVNSATNTSFAGKTNPATLVVDTTKTVENDGYSVTAEGEGADKVYSVVATYYLQNGQYITIENLPLGAEYEVSENAEDYTPSDFITKDLSPLNYDGVDGNDAFNDALSGQIADKDIYTGFTNNRTGAIPTGIIASIAGPLALAGVGVVGAIGTVIYLKKKKSEEEN